MYIDKNGNKWYKGNLHTHTTNSDGRRTPEEVKELYKSMDYDFIALTDHWYYGEGAENDLSGLLVISGIEYNFNGSDVVKGVFHILSVGSTQEPKVCKEDSVQETIDKINSAGGLAILAHPAWSMNTCDMIMPLKGLFATEIYNSISGVPFNCRPYSGEVVDQLAARGYNLLLIADDDAHFYKGEEGMSYILVNLEDKPLTTDNIMNAVKTGKFIATQGPFFEIFSDDEEVIVKSETPLSMVTFFTDTPFELDRCTIMGDKPIYEAHFKTIDSASFVRAECTDLNGKVGYSHIIPLMKRE